MSTIPDNLLYTKTHEWILKEADGTVKIGITDHAQQHLGDIVFVDLPEMNTVVEKEKECCVVESVKAASDIYAPLSGEIIEVNEELRSSPELINKEAYGQGWIFRMKLSSEHELNELLDANAYREIGD